MKAEFASIVLSVAGPVLSAAHDRVWFGFKSRLVYEARDGPSFPCKFTLLRNYTPRGAARLSSEV